MAEESLSPTNFNFQKSELTLDEVLRIRARQTMLEIHCHHVGTIQSFDPDKQVCTATINYKKTFIGNDGKEIHRDYPVLGDVPVVFLGGKKSCLTFPSSDIIGSECLLLFNDRALDVWWSTGQITPLESNRLHDFSDAIAIVGIRSVPNALGDYDPDRARLKGIGSAELAIAAEKIRIQNETKNLNTLLQQLITVLSTLTVDVGSIGPAGGIISPTVVTQLQQIATDLGGLLE